jgi:hypothetical protein
LTRGTVGDGRVVVLKVVDRLDMVKGRSRESYTQTRNKKERERTDAKGKDQLSVLHNPSACPRPLDPNKVFKGEEG